MFFKQSISLTLWWTGRQTTALVFEKEIGIKCGAINTKELDLTDERLETLYRSLYLYIILDWTVVIPLRLYRKPSTEDVLQVENEKVPLEDTVEFFSVRGWAGSHSYLCQKKPAAFRPLFSKQTNKEKNKNKNTPSNSPRF